MERISHWQDDYGIKFQLPKQGAFWLKLAAPILLVLWLLSGIYIVRPDEQGVVRRFGIRCLRNCIFDNLFGKGLLWTIRGNKGL